jgi:uncharacterized membrane protein YjgN (DUF898 family)
MPMTTLTCPLCGFFKEVQTAVLPRFGTRVTCPRCQEVFILREETLAPAPGAHDAAAAALPREETGSTGETPPAAAPKEPAAVSLQNRTLAFTFTGTAKEYFGIWIVNTLLRIVTLGIYSPWAKVRKRRYFYGNTFLNEANFDYLADPLAILKGWFIAGAFFVLYSLASQFSPILALVFMAVLFGLFPWVVVRSRIFNLRNSSHRNIRFGFTADYREAYRVFLWWQLLAGLTLGILAPYVIYRQKRFLVEKSSYGTTPFSFDATPGQFYRVFFPLLVLVPIAVIVFGAVSFSLPKENQLLTAVPVVLFPLVYFIAGVYVPTALANLTWNSTGIGSLRFNSSLRVRDLVWIYFSNGVAIICTLGMLAPWAAVRLARYRLDRLSLAGRDDFDTITAAAAETVSATGEELGDMLGYDFGL